MVHEIGANGLPWKQHPSYHNDRFDAAIKASDFTRAPNSKASANGMDDFHKLAVCFRTATKHLSRHFLLYSDFVDFAFPCLHPDKRLFSLLNLV